MNKNIKPLHFLLRVIAFIPALLLFSVNITYLLSYGVVFVDNPKHYIEVLLTVFGFLLLAVASSSTRPVYHYIAFILIVIWDGYIFINRVIFLDAMIAISFFTFFYGSITVISNCISRKSD